MTEGAVSKKLCELIFTNVYPKMLIRYNCHRQETLWTHLYFSVLLYLKM